MPAVGKLRFLLNTNLFGENLLMFFKDFLALATHATSPKSCLVSSMVFETVKPRIALFLSARPLLHGH